MKTFEVWTDGSSLGNPGPAGWAWYSDEFHWRCGGWKHATNNRGEMASVVDVLLVTAKLGVDLRIYSDSKTVVNIANRFRMKWKEDNWRRKGGEIKNLDLVKALDAALENRSGKVQILWVKSHAGIEPNERVDKKAKGIAEKHKNRQPITAADLGPGWNGKISSVVFPSELGKEKTTSELFAPLLTAELSRPADKKTAVPPDSQVKKNPDAGKNKVTPTQTQEKLGEKRVLKDDSCAPKTENTPRSASSSARHLPAETNPSGSTTAPSKGSGNAQTGSENGSRRISKILYYPTEREARRIGEVLVKDQYLEVPLLHPTTQPPKDFTTRQIRELSAQKIPIYYRLIRLADRAERPMLIFFQGGPGMAGDRLTDWRSGWHGEILKYFNLVMLDQRGTGRSAPLDSVTLKHVGNEQAYDYLRLMRADQIVADAEAIRKHLKLNNWAVMGQSYGGFIITHYLSKHPDRIKQAFITGGLPGLCDIDQIYKATYQATAENCQAFYQSYPYYEKRVRQLCSHLNRADPSYRLPNGDLLTSTYFRMLGMNLGRTEGQIRLDNLLENPMVVLKEPGASALDREEESLQFTQQFMGQVYQQLNFDQGILYALMHESIYANAVADAGATRWAADRLRRGLPGFDPQSDPLDKDEPYYLTGEHFGQWLYQPGMSLGGFKDLADRLANFDGWPVLYDPAVLSKNQVPVYAMIYQRDMFVPYQLSLQTAKVMGAKYIVNREYQHNGLRCSGTKVISELLQLAGVKPPVYF